MIPLRTALIFDIARRAGLDFLRGSADDKKVIRCVEAASHSNGDKHPSAWLHGPTNSGGCSACGARWSAKTFAAAVGVDWSALLDRSESAPAKSISRIAPAPPPPQRILPSEIEALWSASRAVDATQVFPAEQDLRVAFYLSARRWFAPALAALDLIRVTPIPYLYDWPSWWPKSWASSWRLITRGYDAAGNIASVHARSIIPGQTPKTRWPKGFPAGYLFADRRGVALLRGDTGEIDKILIVEGLSDLIAMSLAVADAQRSHAILGITAGATKTLREIRWPNELPIVIATDHDDAGERYAADLRELLPSNVRTLRTRRPDNLRAVLQ